MSDYKDCIRVTDEELLEMNNLDLRRMITNLYNQLDEQSKYTARVYAPNKSYKELEEKLAATDTKRQKDIDELWETLVVPLQNKVKDQHIQLESIYKRENKHTEEISHLKKIIDRLNTIVNYAVGYISACEQFRDKHPNYVKSWLFEELK
jgi:chromosome segregation ATPase